MCIQNVYQRAVSSIILIVRFVNTDEFAIAIIRKLFSVPLAHSYIQLQVDGK